MARRGVLFAALLLCAVPAHAQQSITLQFADGLVTLRAQNAPVKTILAEWARLGGATIVNGDRVTGPPVTLELTAVPERQALDIVLRNVAGYLLAPRRADATGASAFDRILILPTSAAPRNPPPPAAAAAAPAGPRPVFPRPTVAPRAGVAFPVERAPDGMQPEDTEPLTDDVTPEDQAIDAPDEGAAPTPGNPFGLPAGSSAMPGVIVPAPRPQPEPDPANRVQ